MLPRVLFLAACDTSWWFTSTSTMNCTWLGCKASSLKFQMSKSLRSQTLQRHWSDWHLQDFQVSQPSNLRNPTGGLVSLHLPRSRIAATNQWWQLCSQNTRMHFCKTWLACGQHAASQTSARAWRFTCSCSVRLLMHCYYIQYFTSHVAKLRDHEALQLFSGDSPHQPYQSPAGPRGSLQLPVNTPRPYLGQRCPQGYSRPSEAWLPPLGFWRSWLHLHHERPWRSLLWDADGLAKSSTMARTRPAPSGQAAPSLGRFGARSSRAASWRFKRKSGCGHMYFK